MAITVVIADDHPLILDGMENLFRAQKDFKVVARCLDGEEALRAVHKHKPDILVLDLQLPGKDGLAVLREMKKERLATRVVILAAMVKEEELVEAIRLGARGLMLKEVAPNLLLECMRQVHAGQLWLERTSVSGTLEKLLQREAGRQQAGQLLTLKETEIVKLAATGLRNLEIAGRLSITEGTVQLHLHHIYQKLGVDSRTKLALWAQEKGLV